MPKREIALIALFHVRWRPLYCKQLRASLFGLSASEYFPPSLATACHKETSVANNTEVATVFFVSLRVSHKLFSMQASFLSPPPCFLEALFSSPLLFLSVAPTERTETDTPPSQRFVCQYGQLGSGTKAHWRCPHTATPLPKQVHNRLAHSPKTPLSPLSSISLVFYWQSIHFKDPSLFSTVGTLLILIISYAYLSLFRLCFST